MKIGFLLGLLVCLGAGGAQALDCTAPQSHPEMMECAGEAQRRAEDEMAAAYEVALSEAGGMDAMMGAGAAEGVAGALEASQGAWVAYRDAVCLADYRLLGGGQASDLEQAGCVTRRTDLRRRELRSFAERIMALN